MAGLSLGALGVVFGDIGTSPIYAFRQTFQHAGLTVDEVTAFGAASVVFWALVIVVSIKYLALVMRADNHGEGGILALTALVMPNHDRHIAPRRGTAGIARVFGPVMVVWFSVIGLLGVRQIVSHPGVLRALSPTYAIDFSVAHPGRSFVALGSIFLVVTGGEALYADMGHFGRRPIQLAWYGFVLPGLVLIYFGQAALLSSDPTAIDSPDMNSSHLELAQSIVADGFDTHTSGLASMIAEARLRRVDDILLSIVADPGAPRVARERALGKVIVALACRPHEQPERRAARRESPGGAELDPIGEVAGMARSSNRLPHSRTDEVAGSGQPERDWRAPSSGFEQRMRRRQ